jgi:hypothetical protein
MVFASFLPPVSKKKTKKIGSEFAYDSLPFQSKEKNYEDY